MTIKKPMLAATVESPQDLESLHYPVLVSPKLDGVRCVTDEFGVPHSRKGDPFQNPILKSLFEDAGVPAYLDGELGVGSPTAKEFFTVSSGAVRRENYVPALGFTFYIFDVVRPFDFVSRMAELILPKDTDNLKFELVPQEVCNCAEDILKWEEQWVEEGYEGIMIRSRITTAPYKHGRASMKSQQLMKYKRFSDTEGVLIGFEEGSTNNNEATKDALGHTKRGSSKAGKVLNGRAGTLLVRSPAFEEVVRIGTGIGLTQALREEMLREPEKYIGRTVTFAFQAGTDYVKARFPSFKGFRDDGI